MELLSVDRTTIYRMLNDGRLPAVRVGGQWRFSRQAIDKWLNEPSDLPKGMAEPSVASPPTDVLPVYCLQPIQEVFAQTSDVGAITTDTNGKPLTPVSNSCAFCNLILATDKGRARCAASWEKLADRTDKHPRLEKCHAGLTYARGRIVVQNHFIAMFFVGQFMVDDAKALRAKAHLAQVARQCEVDVKALTQAARTMRVFDHARAERLLNLLQLVADTYSHIGEERLDLMTRLNKVAAIVGAPAG